MNNDRGFCLCIFALAGFWMYFAILKTLRSFDNFLNPVTTTLHNFLDAPSIPAIVFFTLSGMTIIIGIVYWWNISKPKKPELYDHDGKNLLDDKLGEQ